MTSVAPPTVLPSTPLLLEMLRVMYLIRGFEVKVQELFKAKIEAGEPVGALHSYLGEEAIAAGVCLALRKDDYVFSTHRGHGHALAKGLDLKRMMAELLGKRTGCCGGRGGSMHLFDPQMGLMGGNGIVGGGLPLALGAGLSIRYRGTDQVAVAFFGDGAASQGSFHESLNMAALNRYPILYVCENNFYAATTPVSKNCPLATVAARAAGYGIPGVTVDGNDVLAVYTAAVAAVARARSGQGPTLVECQTYRVGGHCMVIYDDRRPEERELWKGRDPIRRLQTRLRSEQAVAGRQIEAICQEVAVAIDDAARFAMSSPDPDPRTVGDVVWAPAAVCEKDEN
jgi:TPP-dependent pyruvate/acetoin dehydrogenase alpha subunit